ncbi:methyltransferase nsun3 protein [Perkinsela sp. CCAP 1560/4]|nr:methyltransferase nsun3 protein [Perkinsela sp. CCAP 1560/4]|eukprot:KNH08716.1 methyltransferase nsun3 protein [Perkinsela sp. CCAP 1560/4]
MHSKCDELRKHYGKRWDALVPCLQSKCPKVALVNKYASCDQAAVSIESCLHVSGYDERHESPEEINPANNSLPHVRNIIVRQVGSGEESAQDGYLQPLSFFTSRWTDEILTGSEGQIPQPMPDSNGILPYFLIDMASLAPVLALNVLPTNDVLDMCAAPGGKMIAIAQLLTPMGSLTVNEASKERCKRLNQAIQAYLSGSPLFEEKKIFLSTRDATRWFAPNKYDRVLLHAPCSAERHLFQMSHKESKKDADRLWASSKTFTSTQISMLIQAIETVKISGRVVYSTSSLSPMENDFVVAKALKRFSNQRDFELCLVSEPSQGNFTPPFPMLAEPTKFGWMYLPDKAARMSVGPVYLAVFEKKEKEAAEYSTDEEDEEEEEEIM